MPTRRDILKGAIAAPTASIIQSAQSKGPRVVVIGAGAFGGWTALELVRRGARVVLLDAWGPGHVRASSGGETRVIRASYGSRAIYTRLAIRALALWREHDARFGRAFFRKTGALWMFGADDSFGRASAAALRAEGLAMERLTPDDAQRRYPQIRFDGVSHVYVEPEAGYLLARRACEHVAERVVAEGGEYRQTAIASPVRVAGGRLSGLPAGGDRPLDADAYVFACGPWLGTLFPEEIGTRVQPTRQSVLYFGTSPGDLRFQEDRLPVWVDYGERLIYGIPGNVHRGFKLADDTAGPPFDPTGGDRSLASGEVEAARAFLKRRFPALGGAPFLGSEVCQYESSPDANFIVDRHPAASNVWIVGGGSGHGYKMGPAIGEMMASLVLGLSQPDPFFSLARFTRPPARAAGSDLRSLWTQG